MATLARTGRAALADRRRGSASPAEGTDPSGVAYVDRAHEAFTRAARAVGPPIERCCAIDGHVIRLCFAGPRLAERLLPALAHLAAASTREPALTVCIWDSASTGTPMPRPDPALDGFAAIPPVQWTVRGRRVVFREEMPSIAMLDQARNLALFWVPDAEAIPLHQQAKPLRAVVYWWLGRRGYQLVHAGAVGEGGAGALLVGAGGAGKSTTALACLRAGLEYAGDDYILLADPSSPRVLSLYCSAALVPERLASFPELRPAVRHAGRDEPGKLLVDLSLLYPARLATGFAAAAILLPRVTNRPRTTVRVASGAECLKALAPNTVYQLPGGGPEDFLALGHYVRALPSYWLELGTDLAEVAEVVRSVLRTARSVARPAPR